MTTIAYKDGILACDTRAVFHFCGVEVNKSMKTKIFKTPHGYMGYAGMVSDDDIIEEIKEGGADIFNEDLDTLWVFEDGVRIRLGTGPLVLNGLPYAAIGSGQHFALGAMAHGASAEEAVRAAMKLDRNTGGKVRTLECLF